MTQSTAEIHQPVSRAKGDLQTLWILAIAFTIILLLEYATPAAYVFGYLYTVPIVLSCFRLRRRAALMVTLIASILTLLNLVVPQVVLGELAAVVNRIITVMALIVTGWLSDRNQRHEAAITQQQAELQDQQQLADIRENFVATLTHDLKTPLLGAIQTLKSLQQEQFGDILPAQKQVFEIMTRSQVSILQMVEMLLDIYRNDAEGLELNCQPLNLADLTADVISRLTPLATERRVHLSLQQVHSNFRQTLWVAGDPLQLQRVLDNLITNGINHAPRGTPVEVNLSIRGNQAVVQVLDSGQGIVPEEVAYLFERFYQGHSERQAKGSGLGLYLSRQIIEAHGGTIWAENRAAQGALFGFKLKRISVAVG
jgi:two-component system, NarL family, sensor kinase